MPTGLSSIHGGTRPDPSQPRSAPTFAGTDCGRPSRTTLKHHWPAYVGCRAHLRTQPISPATVSAATSGSSRVPTSERTIICSTHRLCFHAELRNTVNLAGWDCVGKCNFMRNELGLRDAADRNIFAAAWRDNDPFMFAVAFRPSGTLPESLGQDGDGRSVGISALRTRLYFRTAADRCCKKLDRSQ